MPTNVLTDAKVRNAKPKEKPYKLADGAGLFLQEVLSHAFGRAVGRCHGRSASSSRLDNGP